MGVLYFDGYRKPEPGDFMVGWRNDTAVGSVHYSLRGQIMWMLTIGGVFERGQDCKSIEEAKEALTAAFLAWCKRAGIEPVGDSTPHPVDHARIILSDIRSLSTRDAIMRHWLMATTQRRLKELLPYDREELRRQRDEYLASLEQENVA